MVRVQKVAIFGLFALVVGCSTSLPPTPIAPTRQPQSVKAVGTPTPAPLAGLSKPTSHPFSFLELFRREPAIKRPASPAVLTSSVRSDSEWTPEEDTTGHWADFYGIPVARVDPADDVLLRYGHYVVSYDYEGLFPVWSAHVLTNSSVHAGADLDSGTRPAWIPDERLKIYGGTLVSDAAFAGNTVYARGHMTSNEEMDGFGGRVARYQTFFTTNAVPQVGGMNSGIWSTLEENCRLLATGTNTVAIFTGPIFASPGKPDPTNAIVNAEGTPLPHATALWKVIFYLSNGSLHAASFIIPNLPKNQLESSCYDYLTTVSDVERQSGLTFLSNADLPSGFKNRKETSFEQIVETRRPLEPKIAGADRAFLAAESLELTQ